MLEVKALPVGLGQANCYIVYNERQALIIDPGAEDTRIINEVEKLEVIPVAILLTHAHYDHIGAVDQVRDYFDLPVYISNQEEDWLGDPTKNLSSTLSNTITARSAEYLFEPDEIIEIADFTFKVVATPGHSPGGVSFIFTDDKFVITGDALFAGSVGRVDLPGSEPEKLPVGIREKLFTLPDNFAIYPGHMGSSTIGHEIQTNPFFN